MTNFDPSTVEGALFWGVLAGVITSAFMFVLGLLFTKVLIPWYQTVIFQGVDLSGVWTYGQTLSGIQYDYLMTLTQHAHRLSGSMTINKTGAPQARAETMFRASTFPVRRGKDLSR